MLADYATRYDVALDWHILPQQSLHEGAGHCPYRANSAFAHETRYISLGGLQKDGLLADPDMRIGADTGFDPELVNYHASAEYKLRRIHKAFRRFKRNLLGEARLHAAYHTFKETARYWLHDYAVFIAISEHQNGKPWSEWEPPGLRNHDQVTIDAYIETNRLQPRIKEITWQQFIYDYQWQGLKTHANKKNVCIWGDVPIYVDHNSADVWAHQRYWDLDPQTRLPHGISGVPAEGPFADQYWDHCVYNWEELRKDKFVWWIERIKWAMRDNDYVRLDHFQGLIRYWVWLEHSKGEWREGPGKVLLDELKTALTQAGFEWDHLFAENIGTVWPDQEAMRRDLGLRGMAMGAAGISRMLQQPCGSQFKHQAALHNIIETAYLVYTGNHDCEPMRVWYEKASEPERNFTQAYLRFLLDEPELELTADTIHQHMIRLVTLMNVDRISIPWWDLIGAGIEAQTNYPGESNPRNWRPRASWDDLRQGLKNLGALSFNPKKRKRKEADQLVLRRRIAWLHEFGQIVEGVDRDPTELLAQFNEVVNTYERQHPEDVEAYERQHPGEMPENLVAHLHELFRPAEPIAPEPRS
jgi:4-alpha-glucanotransferase